MDGALTEFTKFRRKNKIQNVRQKKEEQKNIINIQMFGAFEPLSFFGGCGDGGWYDFC